jgi:tRNA U38,U39,U40 pseudouridine synthase TruA
MENNHWYFFLKKKELLICRLVEKHLGQFVDERKAKQLEARSLPIEGCAVVAGRTDKGVTALQQVCSFC